MKKMLTGLAVLAALCCVFHQNVLAGSPPSGPPGSPETAMHSLEDIYNLIANIGTAQVVKTGYAPSHATGDDGDHEKGIAWPVPRFTDNGDGTVTDNLTGLIWLKNANRFGIKAWVDALNDCNNLKDDGANLTDGSLAGDWRLPNVKELQSLIDFGNYNPALPANHPFIGVQPSFYWLSTTYADFTDGAWSLYMYDGYVGYNLKTVNYYVWPVRGGN